MAAQQDALHEGLISLAHALKQATDALEETILVSIGDVRRPELVLVQEEDDDDG